MFYQYGIFLVTIVSVTSALPQCTCPRDLRPVCGSDGTTYNNECLFNCARSVNTKINIEKYGSCEEEQCLCTYNYSPVCGTDGRTYGNECSLRCVQKRSPLLDVKHTGKCQETQENEHVRLAESPRDVVKVANYPDRVKVANYPDRVKVANYPETVQPAQYPTVKPCRCELKLNQVCGTDGQTYANLCLLNCASQIYGGAIGFVKLGHCGAPLNGNQLSCSCTRELKPVCGTDGLTYNNRCLLECAGVSMARAVPCEIVQHSAQAYSRSYYLPYY